MGDFLKGWRRKVGCITLFLMLQATGWWILNQGRVATLRISGSTSLFEVASIDGKLWFVAARSTRPSWISYWPSIEGSLAKSSILDGNGNIRYYSFGNQFGPDIIAGAATWTPWNHAQFYGVSFLSVILLLTPLSAYLLFDKQRRKNSLHMIACDSFAIVAALTMALAADHPWNRGEIYVVSLSAMLLLTLVYVFFCSPSHGQQTLTKMASPHRVLEFLKRRRRGFNTTDGYSHHLIVGKPNFSPK